MSRSRRAISSSLALPDFPSLPGVAPNHPFGVPGTIGARRTTSSSNGTAYGIAGIVLGLVAGLLAYLRAAQAR